MSQETFPMRALDVYVTEFLAENLEPFAVKMVTHPLCESDYNPLDIHRSSGRVAREGCLRNHQPLSRTVPKGIDQARISSTTFGILVTGF